MSKNIQEERYRWIKPILDNEIKIKDLVKLCPYSERSIKRWLKVYREQGIEGLTPKSTRPKTCPHETPIRIKEEVIALRKETKLCALKLHWKLEKIGISVPTSTIGKIIRDEGLTRTYRKRRIKYQYVRAERKPGELIEIDVKEVPGPIQGKKYYQYTAIDTASRWRYLHIFDEQSNHHSVLFLKIVMQQFPYPLQAIKTDNHATFTNRYTGTNKRSDMTVKRIHALDQFCAENNIIHYLIDKGKPTQNGTVERSHREDQEKFYDMHHFKNLKSLKTEIRIWNDYYNNLEHCSLDGKTPNEMLELWRGKSAICG